MRLHPDITLDLVMSAVQRQRSSLDNPGFCSSCGAESEGHEPDAEENPCEICGENQIFGAEAILFMLVA